MPWCSASVSIFFHESSAMPWQSLPFLFGACVCVFVCLCVCVCVCVFVFVCVCVREFFLRIRARSPALSPRCSVRPARRCVPCITCRDQPATSLCPPFYTHTSHSPTPSLLSPVFVYTYAHIHTCIHTRTLTLPPHPTPWLLKLDAVHLTPAALHCTCRPPYRSRTRLRTRPRRRRGGQTRALTACSACPWPLQR